MGVIDYLSLVVGYPFAVVAITLIGFIFAERG